MSIGLHARTAPDRAAVVDSVSGETITYRELDARSNQLAHYLAANGLRRGATVALFMENNVRFMEVVWAARRSGLYLTTVNRYLTAEEAAYIINDSDAVVLITSKARLDVASALGGRLPNCRAMLMTDGTIEGWTAYETAVSAFPVTPLDEEWVGEFMLYSSGTTGRPKGVRRPLRALKVHEDDLLPAFVDAYGFSAETIYLSPAPMYTPSH